MFQTFPLATNIDYEFTEKKALENSIILFMLSKGAFLGKKRGEKSIFCETSWISIGHDDLKC
jgi:hypothetical protein